MCRENELMLNLLDLEYEGKREQRHYSKLVDFFKEWEKEWKRVSFRDIVDEGIVRNSSIDLMHKVDILFLSEGEENANKRSLVLVEYKRFIKSGEFDAKVVGNKLFLPKDVKCSRERDNENIVDRFLNNIGCNNNINCNGIYQKVKDFTKDRNGGFWLHKNGSGVGQILNYYFCYLLERKCSNSQMTLSIFAILTNGIEWVLFNYSLEEVCEIFRYGFSDEKVGRDKVNFFTINEWNSLRGAIRELARGNFPEREEFKKIYILPRNNNG